MLQWDDLRFFLAAARCGSFSEAASAAMADTATVSRRIARLESSMKATLFVRSATGLKLTAYGREIINDCETIEAATIRVQAPGAHSLIAGTIRISTSEGFGGAILAPALPTLIEGHPKLTIEMAANAGFLSASTREVDIAVTLSAPNDPRLIVEPLTAYRLGLYVSKDYIEKFARPKRVRDLRSHVIVGYVDDLLYAPELRYLDEVLPELKISIGSTSINAQKAIIANGGGVGVLPKFLASGLVQLFPQRVSLERRFWISTHRDVAETARIKYVSKWMRQVAKSSAQLLY